jgi:hypothetical protein
MKRDIHPMKAKKFGGKYQNFNGLKEEALVEELNGAEEVI